eukprot:1158356-Pelagomonas_calceolata.AAC.3
MSACQLIHQPLDRRRRKYQVVGAEHGILVSDIGVVYQDSADKLCKLGPTSLRVLQRRLLNNTEMGPQTAVPLVPHQSEHITSVHTKTKWPGMLCVLYEEQVLSLEYWGLSVQQHLGVPFTSNPMQINTYSIPCTTERLNYGASLGPIYQRRHQKPLG